MGGCFGLLAPPRVEQGHPRHRVVWQCTVRDDSGWAWQVDYSRVQSGMLEAAWQADARSVEVDDSDSGNTWTVDFGRMLQINDWTETIRPVRRVIVTHE